MPDAPEPAEDQLHWLWWAVDNASVWATEDRALLRGLGDVFAELDAQPLLKELERRLGVWPVSWHERTALVLIRLHATDDLSAQQAQLVDRAMLRLVPQLRGKGARELARTSLSSPRLLRRRAAWRYFTRQGSDGETMKTLKHARPEKDKAFLEWLVVEPRLAQFVELDVLLPEIASFYWRARIMAIAIRMDRDAVAAIADLYPTETLIAIRWSRQSKDVALVRDVLKRHAHNPSVVTEAIRAFATFRAVPDMEHALTMGRELLRRDPVYRHVVP
jgi:hypothetical protein